MSDDDDTCTDTPADDPATLHHRYRGEDLRRYRAALYAQWLASRDGLSVPDAQTSPYAVGIDWDDDDRARAVTFYGQSYDLRIRLP